MTHFKKAEDMAKAVAKDKIEGDVMEVVDEVNKAL